MKKSFKTYLSKPWMILLAALVIGSLLRLPKIQDFPPGYTWDEAAITYDAWGIADWHRDQWVDFMPLTFRSFGDYKAPGLIYILAVIFMVTGVDPVTIRIVSALFGVALIAVTYFLANELFPKHKYAGAISAVLMAISPWSIHLSRVGFEANIAVTLTALGIWLLLWARRKPWLFILSAVVFLIDFYTYQSTKMVIPLIVGLSLWFLGKNIGKSRKWLIIFLSLMLLGLLPYAMTINDGGGERARQALVFWNNNQLSVNFETLGKIASNTIWHLSPGFLILGSQENLRHIVPGFGILWMIDLFFLAVGGFTLRRQHKREGIFLALLIVICFLPSILSVISPHALRSANALPYLYLVISMGVIALYDWTATKYSNTRAKLLAWIIGMGYLMSLVLFIKTYVTTYAIAAAPDFQYGYKQVFEYIGENRSKFNEIVVTDAYGQPYIFTLLYLGISPEKYQAGALANFTFRQIHWPEDKAGVLYVATPEEIDWDDPAAVKVIYIPGTDQPIWVIART